jgi:hypothetical protein
VEFHKVVAIVVEAALTHILQQNLGKLVSPFTVSLILFEQLLVNLFQLMIVATKNI